jgi:hypothetical protein
MVWCLDVEVQEWWWGVEVREYGEGMSAVDVHSASALFFVFSVISICESIIPLFRKPFELKNE